MTGIDPHPLMLWYDHPAGDWLEAIPIGNGRLGAMVFGAGADEHLQINEETLWSGQPRDYTNPDALKALPRIEELLKQGRQEEAEALALDRFMSAPLNQEKYLPFIDLHIESELPGPLQSLRRALDLTEAVAKTSFKAGGVRFQRECFASFPDQVLVVNLRADQPGALNLTLALSSPHQRRRLSAETTAQKTDTCHGTRRAQLHLQGQVSDYVHPRSGQIRPCGVHFAAVLAVRAGGGTVTTAGERLRVCAADTVTLILAGHTNHRHYDDIGAEPLSLCRQDLERLKQTSVEALRDAHRKDWRQLFETVSLRLGPEATTTHQLPTDQRLRQFRETDDPSLVALMVQYGRYLLIASSRPGSQPANLQGIWNASMSPPWDSKWTVNINTEMNYWPAETTGLAECHAPLFDLLEDVAQTGARTARVHYGAAGWVLHHNTDLWRGTAPINHSNHGIWPTGGAWLCRHLWEHVVFSGDLDRLKAFYPIMREAACFFLDRLQPHPETGELVSMPSNSPEQGGLVIGPTMDQQIIRELFTHCILAATHLDTDRSLRQNLRAARDRLAPNRIGRWGQLQEWLEDVDDPRNPHRHLSHLYALYPGDGISPLTTPDLAEAARISLTHRGDAATGWSMGWKINLWARLFDGDHAYAIVRNFFTLRQPGESGGGIYPNLFCAHPPFQIDGNFGAAAGVVEMLLQSHVRRPHGTYLVHLLPALPRCWSQGAAGGLRARGGITVDLSWTDRKLVRVTLHGKPGKTVPLRYDLREVTGTLDSGGQCTMTLEDFARGEQPPPATP